MHSTQMFTWEPVSNLDCPEIIEAYEKAKKDKTTEENKNQELKQEVKQDVKQEVKQEVKQDVKRKVNDTKQSLLKRPKKKSKKASQHDWKPLMIDLYLGWRP